MARKNNELRFIKIGNSLALTRGHKVKAGDGREMFRSASGAMPEIVKAALTEIENFKE